MNFQDFSASIPKQETLSSLAGDDLFWSEVDVIQATDNFNPSHKISEGTFADVYRGHKRGTPFIFKKLREVGTSWFPVRGGGCMVRLDFHASMSFPTDGLFRSRISGKILPGRGANLS